MAEVVSCPDCDAKLKLKAAPAAGKKIRCPKCSVAFVPAGAEVDDKQGITASRSARSGASSRSVADDDDDRPRRARERDRGDDDEPEEEDRPRRSRKKKRASKSSTGLLLGLLIGGGALVFLIVAGIVTAIVLFVVAQPDPYKENEAVAKDMVSCLEELVSTMESIKDRNSAKTGADKINQICDRLERLGDRAQKLPKLPPDQAAKLKNELLPKVNGINQRMFQIAFQAGVNSQGEPSFLAAAQRLQRVGTKLQHLGV